MATLKKILVTGSNGLLGQKITDLARIDPHIQLIATSKGPDRHPAAGRGYTYLDLDLLEYERVRQVIRDQRPEVIIHTAAMTNVDACEEHPDKCDELNVGAVKTLSMLCEELEIHLIHLSTDFIFDGEQGPYPEDAQPAPLSHYGESKLASEQIVQNLHSNWTIIRTILVYGVLADRSKSNIVLWAKTALEKGDTIQVVEDQWRMPTLAEDLATACLEAALNQVYGIFHVSGEDYFSIIDLVREVADFWGLDQQLIRPVNTRTLNQKASRPPKTGFILDKARDQLNYTPTPFRIGLELVKAQLKSSE